MLLRLSKIAVGSITRHPASSPSYMAMHYHRNAMPLLINHQLRPLQKNHSP